MPITDLIEIYEKTYHGDITKVDLSVLAALNAILKKVIDAYDIIIMMDKKRINIHH